MIGTIQEAQQALTTAELDVIGDMGEDALEAAYGDIVRSIAEQCTPEVAAELMRRNGI